MEVEDIKEQVEEFIKKGKALLSEGEYSDASDEFSKGIDVVDPTYHYFHHPNVHPDDIKEEEEDDEARTVQEVQEGGVFGLLRF